MYLSTGHRTALLRPKPYGDKVGFHYYEDEDLGIFWSNDTGTTVDEMVRSIGVLELEEEMAQVRTFYRKAGGTRY